MAIERKTGGYLYRKTRQGGRVVSDYLGIGEVAELYARLDVLDRLERERQQSQWHAERARIEAADELVAEVGRLVHGLVGEELTAAGYHQHKRQWRKRRD